MTHFGGIVLKGLKSEDPQIVDDNQAETEDNLNALHNNNVGIETYGLHELI